MAEVKVTKQNFDKEVLEAKELVVLDFWATWCGPCQMLAPVLEEIALDYAGKAKVGKVNVDDEMELAQQFRVASIPTLVFFKDGKILGTEIGYKNSVQMHALVDSYL